MPVRQLSGVVNGVESASVKGVVVNGAAESTWSSILPTFDHRHRFGEGLPGVLAAFGNLTAGLDSPVPEPVAVPRDCCQSRWCYLQSHSVSNACLCERGCDRF